MTLVFVVSGTTTTVPADWNSSTNNIDCIGAGGSGCSPDSFTFPTGGAGGAWARGTSVVLTPSASINCGVGVGGVAPAANSGTSAAGTDTWIGGSNFATSLVGAKGGAGGTVGGGTSAGGAATACRGGAGGGTLNPGATFAKNGGNGANANATAGGGGGGAAGPNGAGNAGTTNSGLTGGAGGSGDGGSGGVGGVASGGAGGNGTEYDATHGCGGGGAGASNAAGPGGAGGRYGAGGGGPGDTTAAAGSGFQGLIVLNYTPASGDGANQTGSNTVFCSQ